ADRVDVLVVVLVPHEPPDQGRLADGALADQGDLRLHPLDVGHGARRPIRVRAYLDLVPIFRRRTDGFDERTAPSRDAGVPLSRGTGEERPPLRREWAVLRVGGPGTRMGSAGFEPATFAV